MARIDLDLAHSYKPNPKEDGDYALLPLKMSFVDGGAYALLGPSGCGKTTMLNIMSGLLVPSHGTVKFDGKDVTRATPQARNIAQVFQFPVIYDTMTVAENLAFPLRNRGVGAEKIKQRVGRIAEMLEMSGQLNQRAAGLAADAKRDNISTDEALKRTVARMPMKRMPEPHEIADLIVFAASERAKFLTGAILSADAATNPTVV